MFKLLQYYGRFQGLRGNVGGLPSWARGILALVALPGIVLIGLSILLFLVSLSALLLLTVPVYRVLRFICIGPAPMESEIVADQPNVYVTSGRRAIDVKIVE